MPNTEICQISGKFTLPGKATQNCPLFPLLNFLSDKMEEQENQESINDKQ